MVFDRIQGLKDEMAVKAYLFLIFFLNKRQFVPEELLRTTMLDS